MKSLFFMILGLGAASVAAAPMGCSGESVGAPADDPPATTFQGRVFDESGQLVGPLVLPKVVKTDAQWREQLTSAQYGIVRRAGTERPFTGSLLSNKDDGVFTCVACRLPLFGSDTKFKSGTGWPSFFKPIAGENVSELTDTKLGMRRTEILCARCDGHLGHVFNDGPQPTGLRYCVNSESLAFTPAKNVNKLAESIPMDLSKESQATDTKATGASAQRASVVIAGGCFWCVEAVFEELDGVVEVISGYAGGSKADANYKDVSSGRTKHAEVVKIVYEPAKIEYVDLLKVHFATHDPTQLNRQGPDRGTQYRSAIFYANPQEQALAQAFIDDVTAQVFKDPVVTTLEPLTEFYPAESYHQNYVCQNPTQGYVRGIALPKVEKVRKQFKDMLKDESPLDKAK